ncbi:hypothetical protein E2C01_086094 [Portunus trituberculatus]|uniref:Uncharacterized protein n=1 Tax=Portunus trituberculatus TaxID=210409 RepID=A0A5B7J8D2_PORTR|nr:hypothetical protein [Portunus trituberculatus]
MAALVSSRGPSEDSGSMCARTRRKAAVWWTRLTATSAVRVASPSVCRPA